MLFSLFSNLVDQFSFLNVFKYLKIGFANGGNYLTIMPDWLFGVNGTIMRPGGLPNPPLQPIPGRNRIFRLLRAKDDRNRDITLNGVIGNDFLLGLTDLVGADHCSERENVYRLTPMLNVLIPPAGAGA